MKKVVGIVAVILVVIFLWFAFQAAREQIQEGGLTSLFTTGFLSDVGSQTTRGLNVYDGDTQAPVVTTEDIGEFSDFSGRVTIEKDSTNPAPDDLTQEHVVLRTRRDNAQPIKITGWSLQSMISDARFYIRKGVRVYAVGEVNEEEDIYLYPGETAVITSGVSPVGVSFLTNLCTGYLGSVQEYEPELVERCPTPASILPPTVENIRVYGDACVEFAASFRRCEYLTSSTEGFPGLSPACRAYLQPALTYTSCVAEHAEDASFLEGSEWRIFLGSTVPLWKEKYEVIRLLDESGKTVDVFAY
ncbi:MAG: hypothetical protein Q8P16_00010 [bacterium]|nr:hypothetical protein [bacterium]